MYRDVIKLLILTINEEITLFSLSSTSSLKSIQQQINQVKQVWQVRSRRSHGPSPKLKITSRHVSRHKLSSTNKFNKVILAHFLLKKENTLHCWRWWRFQSHTVRVTCWTTSDVQRSPEVLFVHVDFNLWAQRNLNMKTLFSVQLYKHSEGQTSQWSNNKQNTFLNMMDFKKI